MSSTERLRAIQQGEESARGVATRVTEFATDAEFDAYVMGFIRYGATLRAAAMTTRREPELESTDPAFAEARDERVANRLLALSRRLAGLANDPAQLAA